MRSPERSLQTPLLDPFAAVAQQAFPAGDETKTWNLLGALAKNFREQLALAGPLAINLVTANAVACINLFFVARGGTMQLAAAALGNNVAVMLGRLVLLGLCGALDTLAAQAWGAGKERRLPILMQRTVVFLWLHCVAISGAIMLLPLGLRALGQDPALSLMVRRYLLALLPAVWLEALSRPITRVLVARGTVTPQMVIALLGLPLNVATNYALVVVARWEYVGAAAAMSAAACYDVVLLLGYVAVSGQWGDVVGTPTKRAFQGWRQLALLAYPAASMKCAESWAFTICTLAASLLPDACIATAAVGVSYNVYGVLFIAFVACSTAACVTVGNRLGAGDGLGAKMSAAASLLIVPPAWAAAAVLLLVPACQGAIMSLFVTGDGSASPGGGDGGPDVGGDGELRRVLRHMFVIVAGLVLLDGVQTVLSGIIQGCGRQRAGALVNLVAFYVFALPLALWLAFRLDLPPRLGGGVFGLGLGPEGLYLGMAAGPAIQTVCYIVILLRTNWDVASQAAVAAAAQSTSSLTGLIRRMDPGALVGPALVRSGGSSSTGLGSMGPYPWLLPVIEERSGEGNDSSDSLLTTAADSQTDTDWAHFNGNMIALAFGRGVGGGGGGGDDEEDGRLLPSPRSGGGSPAGSPRGAGDTRTASFGRRAGNGPGAAVGVGSRTPRRQSSRLRNGFSGAAATSPAFGSPPGAMPRGTASPGGAGAAAASPAGARAEPKGPLSPPAPCEDVSPGTAARSQALIMTRGSPPTTDPAHHCRLAATLEPGSPATAMPRPYVIVPGSQGSCQFPVDPQYSPGTHAPVPGSSAPVPVPTPAAAAAAGSGSAGGAAAATRTAATDAAAPRWSLFGWGRAQAPAAAKPAATAAARVAAKEDALSRDAVAIAADAASAPLQLPGVATAVPIPCGRTPDTRDYSSIGADGALAALEPSPCGTETRSGTATQTGTGTGTSPLPIIGGAAMMGGRGSFNQSGMRMGFDGGRGEGEPPGRVAADSPTSSAGAGPQNGHGHGQVGFYGGAVRGEVFRSCESLAAAVPGALDFYAFSASAGTDGGGWLDGPPPLPHEHTEPAPPPPPAQRQQQRQ